MKITLISILCLFLSISLVSCQKVDIADVSAISDRLLGIGMVLDDITSDITAILNIEVATESEIVVSSISVNILANSLFQEVSVDVGANINLNDGEVVIKVDILEIISLDLNVDIGDNIVGNLLDGVLEEASGLLQNLYKSLFSNLDVTIEIIDSQVLVNGEIQVALELLDNVAQTLPIELNVEIMVGNELINLDSSVGTFSGNRNEIIYLYLDLSLDELTNIDLEDVGVSVQVSLSVLNLLDVNVDVGVELQGLNELIDIVLNSLESAPESSNIQVEKSIEISDVSLDRHNILTASVQVNGDINVNLSVKVHVMIFGDDGDISNLAAIIHLDGIDGEIAEVSFNLSGVINADVSIYAMVSLSDLNISADVDVSLGDLEILSIVNGNLNEILGDLLGNL